ncbi:cold shock domain-containing protein [bacterium]|nr:cold shock domain-containing protein [bacterium]MCP5462952.1 cold shock domain-containing protein [bacterium]
MSAQGKIKKIIREKGFGFIETQEGRDVFFHKNALVDMNFETLNLGEEVQFEIEKTHKGPRAINVTLAE